MRISEQIQLKYVPNGTIDNKSSLFQAMTQQLIGHQ